jgi:hypothetical protein
MRRSAAILLMLLASPAQADDAAIGFVKTLAGHATVIRGGTAKPVELAMPLYTRDRVETAKDGEVGITFRDDTRISLGPDSQLELPSFVFKPADKQYGFVLRLVFGTMQYLSGLTAKLAPDAMSIETPTATIAVRGTRFLVRAEK